MPPLCHFLDGINTKKSKLGKFRDGQIIGSIKWREKNNQPVIYWSACGKDGTIKQEQFYWGERPREKLERLIHHLNHRPSRYAHRISRMVGLKSADLTEKNLRNSFYFRNHILKPLKNSIPSRFRKDRRLHPDKPPPLPYFGINFRKRSLKEKIERLSQRLAILYSEFLKDKDPLKRGIDPHFFNLFSNHILSDLKPIIEDLEQWKEKNQME